MSTLLNNIPAQTPSARGPASEALLRILTADEEATPAELSAATMAVEQWLAATTDLLTDDDMQLTLYLLYLLHYGPADFVYGDWEWHPHLLGIRHTIETALEAELRAHSPSPSPLPRSGEEVAALLFSLTAAASRPALATWVARDPRGGQQHQESARQHHLAVPGAAVNGDLAGEEGGDHEQDGVVHCVQHDGSLDPSGAPGDHRTGQTDREGVDDHQRVCQSVDHGEHQVWGEQGQQQGNRALRGEGTEAACQEPARGVFLAGSLQGAGQKPDHEQDNGADQGGWRPAHTGRLRIHHRPDDAVYDPHRHQHAG